MAQRDDNRCQAGVTSFGFAQDGSALSDFFGRAGAALRCRPREESQAEACATSDKVATEWIVVGVSLDEHRDTSRVQRMGIAEEQPQFLVIVRECGGRQDGGRWSGRRSAFPVAAGSFVGGYCNQSRHAFGWLASRRLSGRCISAEYRNFIKGEPGRAEAALIHSDALQTGAGTRRSKCGRPLCAPTFLTQIPLIPSHRGAVDALN